MTYSSTGQLNYGMQQTPLQYDGIKYKKPSVLPLTMAGIALGGLAGAGYGSYKSSGLNSYITQNGEVADSFAKSTFEKYVNTSKNAGKEAYNGGLNILNKIDSVNKTEELKQLFENNKDAADDICKELKQTPEDFIKNITNENLVDNKKVIKEKIKAGNNTRYQDMKNKIQACWNKDKKKFVKSENVSDELFKIIKKGSSEINWKMLGKFAAIGSAISGVIAFIMGKFLIK